MWKTIINHKLLVMAIVLLTAALAWFVIRTLPYSESDVRRSACLVVGKSYLCLQADSDTIVLRTDPIRQEGVWMNRQWWWPSCNGRVLTVRLADDDRIVAMGTNADNLSTLVKERTDSLQRLLQRKLTERKELQYYLRSHGVIDEGFTKIAAYADRQNQETNALQQLCDRLSKVGGKRLRLFRKTVCRVEWMDGDSARQSAPCEVDIAPLKAHTDTVVLRAELLLKPRGTHAISLMPWRDRTPKRLLVVNLPVDSTAWRTLLVGGTMKGTGTHDVPRLFARPGSPVFTSGGRFVGVVAGRRVKP